jgi:hypothetical protein
MRSPGAGGCDFATAADTSSPNSVLWTAHALPSVIALTALPADLAGPSLQLSPIPLGLSVAVDGPEHLIAHRDTVFRVHVNDAAIEPTAVLLPLDQFFESRATAAIRLWRGLAGRNPGPNPAALPKARRDRLVLALRALDGRLDDATYREIATALFGDTGVSDRGWKSHDLRDRTIRLVRFGLGMMRSGYRGLLNYPFRGR